MADNSRYVKVAGVRSPWLEDSFQTWFEQQPQRQDSVTDQLVDLHRVAARLGMYDAADYLWKAMRRDAHAR